MTSTSNHQFGGPSKQGRNRPRNRKPRHPRMHAPANRDPFAGPKLIKKTPPPSFNGNGVSILWFRNDLRVHDNEALVLANSAEYMMPVYVFDTAYYSLDNPSPYGFQRIGPFRAHFLKQAVEDIRKILVTLGSDILIRWGSPIEILKQLVDKLIAEGVKVIHFVAHKETTYEEVRQEQAFERTLREIADEHQVDINVHWVWGSTMHHLDDLPFNPRGNALPKSFTRYRQWIESQEGPMVRDEIAKPEKFVRFPFGVMQNEIPSLGDDLGVEGLAEPNDYPFPEFRAVMDFIGGPTAADERLHDYIWEKRAVEVYKKTRDSSGSMDFSSKFSPWLAIGSMSPRTIYWQVKTFEMKNGANESTYWLIFELMWRDYFRWVSAGVGTRLFAHNGYKQGESRSRLVWNLAPGEITDVHRERLQKWIDGNTGAPFVDASMRELKFTGFMSNRGRQNCASFLIHDLDFPDWRAGAEYFESTLIDHDVASNWANWATIAGVGSDSRGSKRFNVIKQSFEYDPDGWFIRRWCPELYHVPTPLVHEPHCMTDAQRELYKNTNDDYTDYPSPIAKLPKAPPGTIAKVKCPVPGVPDLIGFDVDDDQPVEVEVGSSNIGNDEVSL